MHNYEWNEFYERYVSQKEEFKFIYQNYSFWLTYDKNHFPCFAINILDKNITENSFLKLLKVLNYFELFDLNPDIILINNPINRKVIDTMWSFQSMQEKLLKEECYFIVNGEIEIYSYVDTTGMLRKCIIAKNFKTREDLLRQFKLDGETIDTIWNELK